MNPSSNQNTPFYTTDPTDRRLIALAEECQVPGSCFPDDGNEGDAAPIPGVPDPSEENHMGLPGFKTKGAGTSLTELLAQAFARIQRQVGAFGEAGQLALAGAR